MYAPPESSLRSWPWRLRTTASDCCAPLPVIIKQPVDAPGWLDEFVNGSPNTLPEELAQAARNGIVPLSVGDPRFVAVAKAGPLKWVVTTDGRLSVVPRRVASVGQISHTLPSGGKPVIADGEAHILVNEDGTFAGVYINNYSGHYRPDEESLDIGRSVWRAAGVTFP